MDGRHGIADSSSTNAVNLSSNAQRRSHDAVIRFYDEPGNVIETHEHIGHFKEP
jgi:hypothetical protein